MEFVIRPARSDDIASVAGWTRDTFSWGDYVADQLPLWLGDADSLVIVCVYDDDVPVAISRAQILSPTEAWLSAARVHPDHRRSGMGMAMNQHGVDWARERGAVVARLAIEEENEAARAQVVKAGYRLFARWVYATSSNANDTSVVDQPRLRPGIPIDAEAAWVYWSQSDLAQAGRDLISEGWRWRRARPEDLLDAAGAHAFFQGPAGWAIAESAESGLAVRWLATAAADAPQMLQDLIELQTAGHARRLELMAPDTPWMTETLQREGFEVRPVLIYAKAL